MTADDIAYLQQRATRPIPDSSTLSSALTLLDVITDNPDQRGAAYDALVSTLQYWNTVTHPGRRPETAGQERDAFDVRYDAYATITLAHANLDDGIQQRFDNFDPLSDNDIRARLQALLIVSRNGGEQWTAANLDDLQTPSRAGEEWALAALNVQLDYLESNLNSQVQAIYRNMAAVPFIPGTIRSIPNRNDRLDGGDTGGATQDPPVQGTPPEQGLQQVADLYVGYAGKVLDLLDLFPNYSARSRLLNALEVVSGKLVEDGQMDAAARVLSSESTRFQQAVEASEWRNRLLAIVNARATLYAQTAPMRIFNGADDILRAAAQQAGDYLSGDGQSVNEDDRTLLRGLVDEANVQADLLKASAANTMRAYSLGAIVQFEELAGRVLQHDYPERVTISIAADGTRITNSTRGDTYISWTLWLDRLVTGLRDKVDLGPPNTLYGARDLLNVSTTPIVQDGTATGQQVMVDFGRDKPQIANLLNAFCRISFGFSNGIQAEVDAGKAAIITALRTAGLGALADGYQQTFERDARTQHALELAIDLRNQRRDFANAEAWRNFAIQFATVDLPILLATTVLSCGTVTAAAAMWRIATGIRLAANVMRAAEIAVSIPVSQAVDRALGRPVDDSFLGTMKQAGMMLGTQVGVRIVGYVGARAFNSLRGRIPSVLQTMPSSVDARGTIAVTNATRGRPDFRTPGGRVQIRATNITREINRRAEVLDITGTVVGFRDVSRLRLTADDLMALSERYNREYSLVTFRDGTQWLFSGKIGAGEVQTLAGRSIVRSVHTEPILRPRGSRYDIPPSVEDVSNYILHRAAGGGGNLEIIVREAVTGRVVTNSYTLEEARALATLYGLGLVP